MDNSEQIIEETKETPEGEAKQTNRTFTQSEVDKLVASQLKAVEEKYAGFDEIKKTAETLKKEKEERKLSEMSEIDRLNALLEDEKKRANDLEIATQNLSKEKNKNLVLSDPKFGSMPRAYKNMIEAGDDIEAITKSAEMALEEFKKDTGSVAKASFGILDESKNKSEAEIAVNGDIRSLLKARMDAAIKQRS